MSEYSLSDGGPRFFSLAEVTARIEKILRPAVGKLFWVKAEVSSGRERGGSFYCDLMETDPEGKIAARISCTIWSRDLAAVRKKFRETGLDFVLEDGTVVGLRCSLQYSHRYGLSLKVADADPAFALGEMELRRREILLRLEKEGLFERNKSLAVPMLPQRIGLVTSRGSAACSDFVETLARSPYGFTLFLADAVMQGARTEGSVLAALEVLEGMKPDLVVVVRGGGSRSDLSFLDNEILARKIARYAIPVWTGIGHETDRSVLDFVSHRPFKTPTAVAEELVARYVEMERHLGEAGNRFRSTWTYRLEMVRQRLDKDRVGVRQGTRKLLDITRAELLERKNEFDGKVKERIAAERIRVSVSSRLVTASARTLLRGGTERLDSMKGEFISEATKYISSHENILQVLKGRFRGERFGILIARERKMLADRRVALRAADPEQSLKRGFALVYGREGRLVTSAADVTRGEKLETRLRDGRIVSTVDSTEKG